MYILDKPSRIDKKLLEATEKKRGKFSNTLFDYTYLGFVTILLRKFFTFDKGETSTIDYRDSNCCQLRLPYDFSEGRK